MAPAGSGRGLPLLYAGDEEPAMARAPREKWPAPPARLSRFAAIAAAVFLSCANPAFGEERAPSPQSFLTERAALALELSRPIAQCVARDDTENPVFHGCIDWHSAVHGVWALSAYSWATGDQRYRPLIEQTLRAPLLAQERAHLKRDIMFEMPYGRAWLLRLAIDYKRAFGASALDAFADDVARSLVEYYSWRDPKPTDVAYRSATWALINLFDYGVARNRPDLVQFVQEKTRALYMSTSACPLRRVEIETREFMSVCANWAWLVSKVVSKEEFAAWLPKFLPESVPMEPIAASSSVHQRGLNFSRSWGLWALYRETADPRYLDLYLRHFRTTFDNPQDWKGDYHEVGHWVAQFGMLGLMMTYYDQR
jgi:hypothetical protein